MKARPLAASPVLALLVSAALAAPDRGARQASSAAPPPTRTDNVREVLHGVEVVDPYRWLEDQNSPETRAWIDAQNRYTRSVLDSIPGRERLRKRIAKLLKVDSVSEPVERKGKYFFTKRLAEQDLPVIVMRNGLRGKDEVLIDPHPMSADHTVSVDIQEVSHDGSLLAYGVRKGGEDQAEVRLMEVASRRTLPDRLPRALYLSVAVKHDNSGLFYSRHGDEGSRVFYHALGADPSGDVELFGKGYGPDKGIDVEISSDGRTLVITVEYGSSADQTEVYVQDLVEHGPIRPVVNDIPARFMGTAAGGRLFLQTNWKAPKNRILAVDLRDAGGAGPERWREIVPESDAVIESFTPAAGKLFVNYTRNASSVLKVYEPDGEKGREGWREGGDIELPAVGSVSGLRGRWESDEVFFSFTSFHIPSTVFRYDAKKRRQEVWARMKVPIRSGRFETQQVWYLSKDGTKIPMFIVSPRKIKRDGSNPTLLTGYGGFNLSEKPVFSARTALWIERGGILALPSLRGGGEFGEDWHRGGMLGKKQNVFDDFIAAAEWLIRNGYTKPSKLAISGGSNGGLLVGAALTQRPELFQAVLCSYPLLDMLRYHKFLVAAFWMPEYGSAEDPQQFEYLRAYSPYQNVKPGTRYPAVLFVTGDSDTRVAPLHARKMAALLQAATASERSVLLRYDTSAGHTGVEPLVKRIEELTDVMSFLLWQVGAARN